MMIISMRALQRTVKDQDNASLIAMMIAAAKMAVCLLSKMSMRNVHVKCVSQIEPLIHKNIKYVITLVQEKCPMGCPCDNYECDLPDKMAVLALYNSGSSSKPSVLIQPNGNRIFYIIRYFIE